MPPPGRQGPSTGSIAGMVVNALIPLALVALMLCCFYSGCLFERNRNMNKQLETKQSGNCLLPEYPEHGAYISTPAAKPGESFESLNLTVVCLEDYTILGTNKVDCRNGLWSASIPKCVRYCKLDNHTSVHYHCLVNGTTKGSQRRACNDHEQSGTVVRPECNSPNYYSAITLPYMECIDGSWDTVVVCSPECGRVTPKVEPLMTDGKSAKQGEIPWHVGVYRKYTKHYKQICGGSIISNRHVISAAHCFWDNILKLLPASNFTVAAGKIYRPWNNSRDVYAQKSDVKEIDVPVDFQGSVADFQADIAVLILEIEFVYNSFVRPICLDFNVEFDRRQLQPGKLGKVAGWGRIAENAEKPSGILKVVHLPCWGKKKCIEASPPSFRGSITIDKFCAGYRNGTALCKGDSGGGLAFPELDRGIYRYYLRGIGSTAAISEHACNTKTLITFTHIRTHKDFITKYP